MATFELLYLEAPHWIWLAIACLFAGASLATGIALLMSPAVAAALVAALALAGVRAGFGADAAIFAVAAAGLALASRLSLRPADPRLERAPADEAPPPPREPRRGRGRPPAAHEMTGRLIGRIGRASSEFANGVGRVWIDGAEWAAELDAGEDGVGAGEPVRIVKVIGGVRLQVHPLAAG